MKKGQKAGFLRPISSIITLAKDKERRNRKRGEEERRRITTAMIALLASMLATFFQKKKKLLDVRGLFGRNFLKNPTRYLISLFAKPKTEIDNPSLPLACQSRRLFRLLIQEAKKSSSLANYDHCQ